MQHPVADDRRAAVSWDEQRHVIVLQPDGGEQLLARVRPRDARVNQQAAWLAPLSCMVVSWRPRPTGGRP